MYFETKNRKFIVTRQEKRQKNEIVLLKIKIDGGLQQEYRDQTKHESKERRERRKYSTALYVDTWNGRKMTY